MRHQLVKISSRALSTTGVNYRSPFMPPVTINHEFHNILPVKWIRPELPKPWNPLRSCDLEKLPKIDPTRLRLEFQPFSEKLDKLPEPERRIFTVEFGRRKDAVDLFREDILNKVKRHKYDNESKEFKIAWATVKIRSYQDILDSFDRRMKKKPRHYRVGVKELIEKRKKWLGLLRREDYKRFEWLIEILGVLYKPFAPPVRIERKAAVDVLVNLYCNEIRDSKMMEYKAQLEKEKVPFLQFKLETLEQIREDEASMNMPSSVDDMIQETVKKLASLKKEHMVIYPSSQTNITAS